MSDEEKTEPNTIHALARELAKANERHEKRLASIERAQAANTELILNEMQRHGTALGELTEAFAALHARVEKHDTWERARAEAAANGSGNGEVLE